MKGIIMKPVKNIIAMEVIDYQDGNFGNELETAVSKIYDKIRGGVTDTATTGNDTNSTVNVTIANIGENLAEIEKLVKNRFGFQIKLIHNSELAAVLPFYPNKNHIFINEYFRGNFTIDDQEKILKKMTDKKGTINLEKAKVGGVFTEYENQLFINFNSLIKVFNLSSGEITAVILHELGHIFYALEYSNRLESTNQVLANIAAEIGSKKKNKDLVYIYKELKSVNDKVTEEDVDQMVNGGGIIPGYKWFKNIIQTVETQMKNKKYDETSFEQMADNFASRFKYGRELVTGLDKLHLTFGSDEKSLPIYLFSELISLMAFAAFATFTLVFFSGGAIFAGILFGLITFLTFRGSGDDIKDYTYDQLKVRYNRIRHQYIERLKVLSLPDKVTKVLINQIQEIDEIMDETSKRKYLLTRIANAIFTNARNASNSIDEQILLEDLAHNDLFLKSAELKTL